MNREHDFYDLPRPSINWERPVQREEQTNNARSYIEARNDLEHAATRLADTGKPQTFYSDDLDTGAMIPDVLTWERIEQLDIMLNRAEQTLAREGVIFEHKHDGLIYTDEGGDSTA